MSKPRAEIERDDPDDPFAGLTTKEAAKLKARLGEDLGIEIDRENMTGREKLYEMFEDPGSSFGAVVVSTIINCMILLSTTTFVIETMPEMAHVDASVWFTIETICIGGFTLDFIIRSTTTPSHSLFWKDPMNVVDFIAIVPFYLELLLVALSVDPGMLGNLRLIRVVRLARMLRILKNTKSGNMTSVIGTIIQSSGAALVIPMYLLALAVVVFASLMYYAERGAAVTCYGPGTELGDGPGGWVENYGTGAAMTSDGSFTGSYCHEDAEEKLKAIEGYANTSYTCDPWDGTHLHSHIVFANADTVTFGTSHHGADCCYCQQNGAYNAFTFYQSIPDALWWSIVTFTTVGYGDKFPITWAGRGVALGQMVVGVFFMAMPLTIVGTAFNAAWEGIQEGEHMDNVDKYKGMQSKEAIDLLKKYYAFADLCCGLEEEMLGIPEKEKVKKRKAISDKIGGNSKAGIPSLKDAHTAFTSSMHEYFEIYQIPEDLRNPDSPAED